MIPIRTLVLPPLSTGSAGEQAAALLDLLARRLVEAGLVRAQVLSLTLFVDTADAHAHGCLKDDLIALVREAFAGEMPPPVTIVAERPELGHLALEACVPAGPTEKLSVVRKLHVGVPYTLLTQGDLRQIHAGGLCSPAACEDPEAQAQDVFARMEAVLQREGLSFGAVVRQWNYIESMLEDCPAGHRDRQRYQVFNDVRTRAYESSAFPAGYPAATGIAQVVGGTVLEFIALAPAPEVVAEPLSNPRQVDAHRYSSDVLVGRPALELEQRTAPKFERAKRVTAPRGEMIFVSGTAAIVGETSIACGDVAAQTRTTLELMDAFLDGDAPSYLRAYVKRAADIPRVREVCEAAYGGVPTTFVQADVCREELLVEMEALLYRPTVEA